MKAENRGIPEGVVVLNYAKAKSAALPSADELDILIPKKVWENLSQGDAAPYFKVEAIEFPARGTGGIYDKSFFKSYLNVAKDHPIPGSKRGHEWLSRPNNDFYLVGGRIDENADGKSGTAYFKMYVPPVGDGTDNAGFIRDLRANIVNFSLVTAPESKNVFEDDGTGNKVWVTHFLSSKGYERNDAVELGAGAMDQTCNSSAFDFDAARALIEAGHFDKTTKSENAIQGETVFRTGLRRMQSSPAYVANASELAELISLIDKSQSNGGKPVELNEATEFIRNALKNSATNIQDIAKNIGFGDALRNEQDVKNAELVKALNAKLGDKPLERLDVILAENAASAKVAVENAVVALVGPAKNKGGDGKDVDNPSYTYAMQVCAGKSGDELKNALESLKDNPVMKAIRANMADPNSQFNRIVPGGAKPATQPGAVPALKV